MKLFLSSMAISYEQGKAFLDLVGKRKPEDIKVAVKLHDAQPGFVELELVRISESKTMSVQTWANEQDWWNALEAVKKAQEKLQSKGNRPSILESRDFLGGHVARHINAGEDS